MGWESINMVRFDLGTLLQGQMRIAKHKSAYNSLIIGPRGWNENQPIENHELGIGVVGFHLGPLLQGQMRIAKLKSKAVTSLEKRHRLFTSKESIRIRVTVF